MAKDRQVSVRLESETIELLDRWREGQDVPPSLAATIQLAIRRFLKAEGLQD